MPFMFHRLTTAPVSVIQLSGYVTFRDVKDIIDANDNYMNTHGLHELFSIGYLPTFNMSPEELKETYEYAAKVQRGSLNDNRMISLAAGDNEQTQIIVRELCSTAGMRDIPRLTTVEQAVEFSQWIYGLRNEESPVYKRRKRKGLRYYN